MPRFQISVDITEVRRAWFEVNAKDDDEAEEKFHAGLAEETYTKHLETLDTSFLTVNLLDEEQANEA